MDLNSYTMKRFSDDIIFYWRILKDSKELEGILVANSTTWIGIGWRPDDLGPTCRSFPMIRDIPEPLPQPEPKLEMEPKSEPEPTAEPEPEPELEPEAEPGTDGEKSIAKRRSAKADAATFVTSRPDVDVTVQTSVTYQVSTKQGKIFYIAFYVISEKNYLSMFVDLYFKIILIAYIVLKFILFAITCDIIFVIEDVYKIAFILRRKNE